MKKRNTVTKISENEINKKWILLDCMKKRILLKAIDDLLLKQMSKNNDDIKQQRNEPNIIK